MHLKSKRSTQMVIHSKRPRWPIGMHMGHITLCMVYPASVTILHKILLVFRIALSSSENHAIELPSIDGNKIYA